MKREYVCFHCKEKIIGEEPVKLVTGSTSKRFHPHCAEVYSKRQDERRKLDEVYAFLKDILHYDKPLNKIQVQSIQALRAGDIVKRGTKVSLNKAGYPYEVILLTMKAKRSDIDKALNSKNFNSEITKTRYVMAIVGNSINDIYLRWENAKKQADKMDDRLQQIDTTQTEMEYVKTPDKAFKFDDLW